MKTIGFIDYYISEWHANNYPLWIKEICEKEGKDFCIKYAWAEEYVSPVDGRNTDEWCKEFGVERCETIEELCEKCDHILILSPSNPEKHLGYAEVALKYKKNTYIDKTFAPDYDTAKKIFDIAEENGTKFFSSSALRFAEELDEFKGSKSIISFGYGSSFEEYIIHQIEMVQKIAEEKPVAVKVEKQYEQYFTTIEYENGKKATMVFADAFPFQIYGKKDGEDGVYKTMQSPYFKNLLSDILRFYESGEVSFDTEQTLSVMKIREAAIKGKEDLGNWQYL
ncbi:MAG: Gfo/Idh/MocA family oxidoreductase [Clostridia bacterium]|nr:Gfo/Idh/MocA family oxidoreductase [Clostridia bacterium]